MQATLIASRPYKIQIHATKLPTMLANARRHWSENNRETKEWDDIIHKLTAGKRPPIPLKRAKITLMRMSSQVSDWDGLVISFKHVVDALVTCRIIQEDSYAVIGAPTVAWSYAEPKKGGIMVLVEEV